ncbi:signal peptide peptidase SppA [Desulfoplanes sp.]
MQQSVRFSARHPFLFGTMLILVAIVLLMGSMYVFATFFFSEDKPGWMSGGEKIGVVNVTGMISSSRRITAWIDKLHKDDSVKGIIVRVNSPGGVVGPSQEIFQAVKRIARDKPTIASMGAVAASGGYYVAAGASEIWANPGTLTASIGVKVKLTDIGGMMQKLGIKEQTITSGSLKNAGTMFRPMTPEEKKYFQGLADDLYGQFITDIATARKMDPSAIKPVADGRAMTGKQAMEAGLVDKMGGFEEAVRGLKKGLGITEEIRLLEGPPVKRSFLSKILTSFNIIPENTTPFGPQWVLSYE